jgi:hypothetical protein
MTARYFIDDDQPVVGWIVRYPSLAGVRYSLIVDEGRAMEAAARMHGTVGALVERQRVPKADASAAP